MRSNVGLFIVLLFAVAPQSSPAQFQMGEVYVGDYQPYVEQVFGFVEKELNTYFKLPEPITLVAGECQQVNAWFVEKQEGRAASIILCKELLDAIVVDIRAKGVDESSVELSFLSQVAFVTLHEVGHGLIRVLDLPTLGREEDAADQFAALLFRSDPILSLLSTAFWSSIYGQSAQYGSALYADTHSLNEQRNYNILCWTYGADPITRTYIVENHGLPAERASVCEGEYDRLVSSWIKVLGPHLTDAGKAAFNSDDVRDASGIWRFVESMADSDNKNRCSASGTVVLAQVGEDLAGHFEQEGTCVFGGLPYDNTAQQVLANGSVTQMAVEFEVEGCTYRGAFLDESKLSMEGTMRCEVDSDEGTTWIFTGTWMAVR